MGGTLTYFVAVYTNPGSSGVVTQLPFMTAVSPLTDLVGVGPNATAAYQQPLRDGGGDSTTASGTGCETGSGGRHLPVSSTPRRPRTSSSSTTGISIGLTNTQALLSGISKLAASSNLNVVNATTVSPNVFINTATVSLAKSGVSGALSQVSGLIKQLWVRKRGRLSLRVDGQHGRA